MLKNTDLAIFKMTEVVGSTGGPHIVQFLSPQRAVLTDDWFSTKNTIYDFQNFKVPFICQFSLEFSRYFDIWNWKSDCYSLSWHVFWEIYNKVWLLDKIFEMDGCCAQFIANKFLRLLQ